MKVIGKRIIISIITLVLCINFVFPNFVYASNSSMAIPTESEKSVMKSYVTKRVNEEIARFIDTYNENNGGNASTVEDLPEGMISRVISYVEQNCKDSLFQIVYDNNKDLSEKYEDYLKSDKAKEEIFGKSEDYFDSYVKPQDTEGTSYSEATDDYEDPLAQFGLGILDGILGIVLYPIKLLFAVPTILMNISLNTIADSGDVSLYTIFFNKIEILKINIFESSSDGPINTIRESIAGFYVALRNLAIVLSLAVLIFIGIQMARNNVAEDRAKYKEWLVNWLVGFGLIFVIHYIIVFVIQANTMLVEVLEKGAFNSDSEIGNFMRVLLQQAWWIPFTKSFGSLIMYLGLTIMSFIFLIVYIKRMITIAFLIVIAPLITVTYSIDKIDNNKSEILNTWLREFLYNVLIQPFHCLLFAVFISPAMDLLLGSGYMNLGTMLYAIILTFSIFMGQKIIREIFGFGSSSSLLEKVAVFAIAQRTISNVKSIVAIKGARNDRKAAKAEKKLSPIKNYAMPGGQEVTGQEMVRLRMAYQRQSYHKESEQRAAKKGKTIPTMSQRRKSIPNRRRLKNAPARIRNVGRWYVDALKTTTGYNLLENARNKHKKSRHSAYKMNGDDYAIAVAQSYREAVNVDMSNRDLANELDRINSKEAKDLNAEELKFKVMMDAVKSQFKLEEDEIKDALLKRNRTNEKP